MESRKKTYHPKSIDFITLPFESQSTQYLLSSSLSKAFSTDWHLSWSCLTLSFSVFRLIWSEFIQETPEKKLFVNDNRVVAIYKRQTVGFLECRNLETSVTCCFSWWTIFIILRLCFCLCLWRIVIVLFHSSLSFTWGNKNKKTLSEG